MSGRYFVAALAAVTLAFGATSSAQAASELFNLSVVDPAAGLGSGPFGSVTVTEDAGALDFLVSLNSGFKIHKGNFNHSGFAFSLSGDPAITISALTSGFSQSAGSSFSEPPFGSFNYALACTGCGPGYGGGSSGPLSFKVTPNSGSLTLASLGFNVVSGQNIYFTSDIVNSDGMTGNVGAVLSAVPEPATWGMLIFGLGLVGAVLRRRTGGLATFA